ncbi:MAG: SufS family cysteine desulfurase [Gemmatimonadetes bacterium]|nr:SufS family cysteine desulfurase [Gemmatimonadota bacterium]
MLQQSVGGRPLVYLDSAATSQKPQAVIDAMSAYYERDNANVHRSIHALAARATEAYEQARAAVARFLGAGDPREIVFVRGATEAVNLVAASWARPRLRPGDEILLSVMEHHSNLVPWQLVAAETGARLRFLDIDEQGTLVLDGPGGLEGLLGPRTRLVALTQLSNGLGTLNPIREIALRAREVGARVLVDGSQSAARLPVDVRALGADFFVCSGHKMYGPMGIGALWARPELLEEMPPYQSGGEMIERVELEHSTWNRSPHKFEAGTPNVGGAVGLAAAVTFLESLGMGAVRAHDERLTAHALERLAGEVPGIVLYGPHGESPAPRLGSVAFTLADVHPHDLATILDAEGVAIRAGHHCNQPLMRRLGVSATARASFGVHNDEADLAALVSGLGSARRLFGV